VLVATARRSTASDVLMDRDRASRSAENVAAARAYLTRRGVLDDAHAERYVRPSTRAVMDLLGWLPGQTRANSWIAARTRFFDELIAESVDDGTRQVVIVAAGYDTRAWRLGREGVRFIEVDHPATQARKKALAPPTGPVYVAADLSVQDLRDVLDPHLRTGEPMVADLRGADVFPRRGKRSEARGSGCRGRLGGIEARHQLRVASTGGSEVATVRRGQATPATAHPRAAAIRASSRPRRCLPRRERMEHNRVLTHADLHAKFLRGTELPQPPPVGSYVCEATK
jgi:hypothetical protein